MATSNSQRFQCCFEKWITQQHEDLDELLQALASKPEDEEYLRLLAEKSIKHFQEYMENRAVLAQLNAPALLSPSWCTNFENSLLWMGGCRPSLTVRLVYSLCGSDFEAGLTKFLQGVRKKNGNLGEISVSQLTLINTLHGKTVREEEKLSTWMASLQDDLADEPLVTISKNCKRVGESSQCVSDALEAHVVALSVVLVDADKLRLSTLKEIITILSPLQSAELLVASKRLHLSLHEWGKQRDQHIGKV